MNELPKIECEPIIHVTATPDNGYPIRILKAYRQNCECKWSSNSNDTNTNPLFAEMNKHQQQRAEILDNAIKILENFPLNEK